MSPERLKTITLLTLLFASLFASCLLAYENVLLRNDKTALQEKLQAEASQLEALENQHRRLLEEHEALLTAHQRLLEENTALNSSYVTLLQSYMTLRQNYTALSGKFEELMASYGRLMVAYAALNSSYAALLQNYAVLQQQVEGYPELQSRYAALLSEYRTLQANYSSLKTAYSGVCSAIYSPLRQNETVTPTVNDLKQWLMKDDTDSIPYSKWGFVCGDYAVTLSIRAKLNRWDMGVVAVIGRDVNGNEFNHVFNAIRCVEGLVYVEPQNDQVFYGPIGNGLWYTHPGFGGVYVETFIIIVPYQPPL